jgi:hypothetical protein
MSGVIIIGCEEHSVSDWIENYKSIGEENDYTPGQIEEYGEYIKICAKFAPQEESDEV